MEGEHAGHAHPGDPSYGGFRAEELWIFTRVDPADDQEGILMSSIMGPLIATDEVRLNELTQAVRDAGLLGVVVKHFKLADSETI